jgi:hypothetical protein
VTAAPAIAAARVRRAGRLNEVVRVLRDPVLVLWSLYLLAFPIYYLKSGLPQPSMIAILLLSPLLLSGRIVSAARRPVRALAFFILYVIVENVIWSMIEVTYDFSPATGFLITPTWYLFDGLVFLLVLLLYRRYRERFIVLTLWLVLLSVLAQSAMSLLVTRSAMGRPTLFFNNPNQLGFYAVLSATLIALGRGRFRLSTPMLTAGLVACVYLALLSASKGALLSIGILIVIGMATQPRTIVLASLLFGFLLLVSGPMTDALDRTTSRFRRADEMGLLESRGYDRIANHKQYWLLGSGEGDYQRFEDTTVIGDHELHSSGGTLFFCYGLVGSVVFLNFLWHVGRRAPLRRALLLLPPFVYGLSHQGLRFTLLWVLLALFVALKDLDGATAPARSAPAT